MIIDTRPIPPRGAGHAFRLVTVVLLACLALAACGPSRPGPGLPLPPAPEPGRPAAEMLADLAEWIHPKDASPIAVFAGDTLSVEVKNHPEYSIDNKVVPSDGVIGLSGLPDKTIQAIGRTPQDLEKAIADAYELVLRNPYVTVNITAYATRVVYVSGEVKNNGKYDIPKDAKLTLIRVLTEAGGLTEEADGRALRILRDDPVTGQQKASPAIDLDVLYREAVDVPLRPNDAIQVPKRQPRFVAIWGKGVQQPGTYPWQEALTISRLVALAGGLEKFADVSKVIILRREADGQKSYRVDLNRIFENDDPDFRLLPDDVVRIDDTFF